jgi:hypothetical protein
MRILIVFDERKPRQTSGWGFEFLEIGWRGTEELERYRGGIVAGF